MKSLFRRSPPSHQVGLLLASDRILLACVEPVPIFTSRAINGPHDWPKAMGELFAQHGLAKSKVRVALAASLYQQIQIDKPAVPDAEMAGALPWAIKDFVNEPVLQLAMDYVDLPTPPAGRPRINVICVPKSRVQQLADAVNGVADKGMPHLLCTYLYELSGNFMTFYEACPINKDGVDEATRNSRLLLCAATAKVLKLGLGVLGIYTLERM